MFQAPIASDLLPLAVAIDELRHDERNARKHLPKSITGIKASLQRFGQQKPIVALSDGKVIAGNGTLTAARELGWDALAVVRFKSEKEARAFALADNRSSELSEWDYEELGRSLNELHSDGVTIEDLGWQAYELEPLMQADWSPPPPKNEGSPDYYKAHPITVTAEQRVVIDRAIKAVREVHGDPDLPEGRCLELICADYLGGASERAA